MNTRPDPISVLEHSARFLDRIPDRNVRLVLERSVAALLSGEDPRAVLGLSGTAGRRAREASRNFWLYRALRQVEGDTRWARCKGLSREIARFESCVWVRWRDLALVPDEASELRTCLFNARRLGPLPSTPEQLRNIFQSMEISGVQISPEVGESLDEEG